MNLKTKGESMEITKQDILEFLEKNGGGFIKHTYPDGKVKCFIEGEDDYESPYIKAVDIEKIQDIMKQLRKYKKEYIKNVKNTKKYFATLIKNKEKKKIHVVKDVDKFTLTKKVFKNSYLVILDCDYGYVCNNSFLGNVENIPSISIESTKP